MKYLAFILLLCSLVGQSAVYAQVPDANFYAVIRYTGMYDPIPDAIAPATLDSNEIALLHKLYTVCIEQYNRKMDTAYTSEQKAHPGEKKFHALIDPTQRHFKQFMAVTDKKGDKIVWVNCLCHLPLSYQKIWRKGVAYAPGSGDCYFNFKVNMRTQQYYDMQINP